MSGFQSRFGETLCKAAALLAELRGSATVRDRHSLAGRASRLEDGNMHGRLGNIHGLSLGETESSLNVATHWETKGRRTDLLVCLQIQ